MTRFATWPVAILTVLTIVLGFNSFVAYCELVGSTLSGWRLLAGAVAPMLLFRVITWHSGAALLIAVLSGCWLFYLKCIRPEKWWNEGCCHSCGYNRRGLPDARCPECGASLSYPDLRQVTRKALLGFTLSLFVAWAGGAVVAEYWLQHDVHKFKEEVRTHVQLQPDKGYSRQRAWPAGDASLVYNPGRGIHATD